MPTDGKSQTYGFLEQLSTEQLLDLVWADSESSENGDDDLTFRILEVIEKREQENPSGIFPDVDKAWEDFQTYFNTPDGTGRPLYPTRDFESGETANRRGGRLLKRLLPLVAVLAVALSGMIAAQALGVDVFGALARWTDETFHFIAGTPSQPGGESEELRQTVQEAFDCCGITIPAPAWYPEGTALVGNVDTVGHNGNTAVACTFQCDDFSFNIIAEQYPAAQYISDYIFEKDASKVTEYTSYERLFYIMSNLDRCKAIFCDGQIMLTIEGELSSGNIKTMIDSMGG